MTNVQFTGRWVLMAAFVAYAYGALLGLFALAWDWLVRDSLPNLQWWQWLLAPLGIGLAAMALEGIGTLITKGDDIAHPTWNRAIRVVALFVVLAALILIPTFYGIANP